MDTLDAIIEHDFQALDDMFDPKRDLEELERLLAEDSDEEQEQAEMQEQRRGVIVITTTWTSFSGLWFEAWVTIPTLEKVLMYDPFLISVQPVPTPVNILNFYGFKLGRMIFETKRQILRINRSKRSIKCNIWINIDFIRSLLY